MIVLLVLGALLPPSIQTARASLAVLAEAGTSPERSADDPALGGSLDAPADAGRLLPEVAATFERARTAAATDGLELVITSGYRTPERQLELFEEAIETYGSVEEARRWVLPPDESNHVRGIAVDVGPAAAADWLARHGAGYGLCQTYAWEWWHFEYQPHAVRDGRCPPPAQ